MKRVLLIVALVFLGCVSKPDICEKQRIVCVNECNNSLCIGKCEENYQSCIKSESLDNIGSFLYNANYFNKKE